MKKRFILSGLAAAMLLSGGMALAADQARAQDRDQERAQRQQTTGSRMMTADERKEHRAKIRGTASREEREKIRAEQHEKMKKRAKEQGKEIPDNPPEGGMGGGMRGGMRGPDR